MVKNKKARVEIEDDYDLDHRELIEIMAISGNGYPARIAVSRDLILTRLNDAAVVVMTAPADWKNHFLPSLTPWV